MQGSKVMDTATPAAVLLVDTNPALLQTLQAVITGSRIQCHTATDSLAALCELAEHRCAVVVIDTDTGPLALWQFCALVRQHPALQHTRLVASSNRNVVVERARASAAGAQAFLPKPFAAEDVLALLAQATGAPA
jgi:twitching motility two-component system response regulator PilG